MMKHRSLLLIYLYLCHLQNSRGNCLSDLSLSVKYYYEKKAELKRLYQRNLMISYQIRTLRADDGIELLDAEFGCDEFCDFGR